MKKFTSYLSLLALSFFAIFAVGCGSDNEDVFSATGGSANPLSGNLSFRFVQPNPQTAGEVPNTTSLLRFDFFRANPPSAESFVATVIRPYAESIVIEDVPTDVILVLVTALDGENFPLVTLQGDAEVILGQTTPVDLGNPTVVTLDTLTVSPDPAIASKEGESKTTQLSFTLGFSNGSVFTLPSFDGTNTTFSQPGGEIADISASGLVSTTVGGQNTTASASFTFGNFTVTDEFDILTYCFEIVEARSQIFIPTLQFNDFPGQQIIPIGPSGEPTVFQVDFVGPDGVRLRPYFIEGAQDVTFSLATPATGVSIDPVTGFLTADETAVAGLITVVVTYEDPVSGLTFTDSVQIELVEGETEFMGESTNIGN